MPRKPRGHLATGCYHVMLRGNNRQNIFYDQHHYTKFMFYMQSAITKYGCKIHLFALMTNHVHLVVEVSAIPLSKIVQSLAGGYAQYLNHELNIVGHLFQGRYHAIPVQDESYLLTLIYYIHNNPIEAKISDQLNDYSWSSHHCYSEERICDYDWVTTDFVQSVLEKNFTFEGHLYTNFMETFRINPDNEPLLNIQNNNYLAFTNDLVKKKVIESQFNDFAMLSINDFIDTICKTLDVSRDLLATPTLKKEVVEARCMIAYFAHYYGRHTFKNISVYFDQHYTSMPKTIQRHIQTAQFQKLHKKLFNILKQSLIEKRLMVAQ